jgi:hypothetical protein
VGCNRQDHSQEGPEQRNGANGKTDQTERLFSQRPMADEPEAGLTALLLGEELKPTT